MTKKHFESFARYIRESGESEQTRAAMAWLIVVTQDNPRFDRSRFFKACGLNIS